MYRNMKHQQKQMAQNYDNEMENERWKGKHALDCFGVTGA